MKTWNETRDGVAMARAHLGQGAGCALVLLTAVKGSAYRRPGAKLLVLADGHVTGNVSGGCLENDLRERAMSAMTSGRQMMVHYNTGSDEDAIWGLGLGCDGELDLLVMPLRSGVDDGWLAALASRMEGDAVFQLGWSLAEGVPIPPVVNPEENLGFVERLEPPPELVVCGAGDDAIPLVALAARAGFRVTVVDHRAGYLDPARFPDAANVCKLRPAEAAGKIPAHDRTLAVVKNHALEMDKAWARYFESTPVCYIGLLGPRNRNQKIAANLTNRNDQRFHGPAGLDLGGEGAEQIALSLVAEMIAVWNQRQPGHLRERAGSIHA